LEKKRQFLDALRALKLLRAVERTQAPFTACDGDRKG
jgi:hypothetical protein